MPAPTHKARSAAPRHGVARVLSKLGLCSRTEAARWVLAGRVAVNGRLVRDPAGDEGWVTANLLSRDRGALVVGDGLAAIRAEPSDGAKLKWNAEVGVVVGLRDCEANWCEVDASGRRGFIRASRLWGAGKP